MSEQTFFLGAGPGVGWIYLWGMKYIEKVWSLCFLYLPFLSWQGGAITVIFEKITIQSTRIFISCLLQLKKLLILPSLWLPEKTKKRTCVS